MAVALGYGVHKVDDGAMYVFSVNGVVKVLDKREPHPLKKEIYSL